MRCVPVRDDNYYNDVSKPAIDDTRFLVIERNGATRAAATSTTSRTSAA